MRIKALACGLLAFMLAGVLPGTASAAAVTCGSTNASYLRLLSVDPGLPGGLCYTQLGNLSAADAVGAIGTGTVLLDKDQQSDDLATHESWLTGYAAALSGTWTVSASAWSGYERLFLGFHFGHGGSGGESNPDSFIVELARDSLSGSWSLGGDGAKLNNLSHIDLFGFGEPLLITTQAVTAVPEPASVALVLLALGLSGVAARRRMR